MFPRIATLLTAFGLLGLTSDSSGQEKDKEKKLDEEAAAVAMRFVESIAKKFDPDEAMIVVAVPFARSDRGKMRVLKLKDEVKKEVAAETKSRKEDPLEEPLRIYEIETYGKVQARLDKEDEFRKVCDAVLRETDRFVCVKCIQNDWGTSEIHFITLVAWRDGQPKVVSFLVSGGGRSLIPEREATGAAKKFAASFIKKFEVNEAMKEVHVPFLNFEKDGVGLLKSKDELKKTLTAALEQAKKTPLKEPLTVKEVLPYEKYAAKWPIAKESVKKFEEAVKHKRADQVVIMTSTLDDGSTVDMFTFVTWRHGEAVVFGYYLEGRQGQKK